jgi:PAS domain S-box-containing protein
MEEQAKKPTQLDEDLKATQNRLGNLERELTMLRLAQQKEAQEQRRWEFLLNAISSYVYTVYLENGSPIRTVHSPQCQEVTGYAWRDYVNDKFLWLRMIFPEDRNSVLSQINDVSAGKTPPPLEHRIIHKDGSTRWIRNTMVPLYDDSGHMVSYYGVIEDITERKRAEQDRETLITELKQALAKIKALSGLLPICSSCKKIRDDKGYWEQIEVYIRDHSDAEFSHSLCPECLKELYPDFEARAE